MGGWGLCVRVGCVSLLPVLTACDVWLRWRVVAWCAQDELATIASDLRAQLATAREEADHTLVADASRSNRDRGEQLSAEVARLAEEQARWVECGCLCVCGCVRACVGVCVRVLMCAHSSRDLGVGASWCVRWERLEAELAEAKGEAAAAARLGLEVSALRDEVDVLRPVRNQLATLQASHTRLKRRLEEAGDAKAALKVCAAGEGACDVTRRRTHHGQVDRSSPLRRLPRPAPPSL